MNEDEITFLYNMSKQDEAFDPFTQQWTEGRKDDEGTCTPIQNSRRKTLRNI